MASADADIGASGLGALEREYGGATPRRIKVVGALGLFLIFPLGLGVIALMIVEPPKAAADWAGAVFLAVMLVAAGIAPAALSLVRRGTRVRLHEHGLVVVRGEQRRVIGWDAIESVRLAVVSMRVNGIPAGTNCRCALQTTTGKPVVLTHWLDGVIPLAQRIEDEVCRRRLPHALRLLGSGGTVEFGRAFQASAQGLAKRGGEPLPWGEIESIAVVNGYVTVRRRGRRWPWARRSYGALPNAMVLLALLRAQVPAAFS